MYPALDSGEAEEVDPNHWTTGDGCRLENLENLDFFSDYC